MERHAKPEDLQKGQDVESLWHLLLPAFEMSTTRLRRELGWERPRFDAACTALVAQGRAIRPEGSRTLRVQL